LSKKKKKKVMNLLLDKERKEVVTRNQFAHYQDRPHIIPLALIAVGWLIVMGMLRACMLLYCCVGAMEP
jgi:hypothetical protein